MAAEAPSTISSEVDRAAPPVEQGQRRGDAQPGHHQPQEQHQRNRQAPECDGIERARRRQADVDRLPDHQQQAEQQQPAANRRVGRRGYLIIWGRQ